MGINKIPNPKIIGNNVFPLTFVLDGRKFIEFSEGARRLINHNRLNPRLKNKVKNKSINPQFNTEILNKNHNSGRKDTKGGVGKVARNIDTQRRVKRGKFKEIFRININ